jgi:putative peptide zinc metalloprotease protein
MTDPLRPGTRVEFRELHVAPQDDGFLVGDVARGEFVVVPPAGITVIEQLRQGRTVGEAGAVVKEQSGEEVDASGFVASLVELGFVASVDGVRVANNGPLLGDGGKTGAVAAGLARPLFSRPAWAAYALLFLACLAVLTAVPGLRPEASQLFFLPNPALSLAVLTALWMPLAAGHELAHWLGARVEGLPARITVSRRYFLLVMQTDLSALWALPRRRRFGPLLAGIAFDTVVTAGLLAVRAASLAGWWHPPGLALRLVAALIVEQVICISLEFVVFLRSDLYAVMVTGLGCLNLSRVSRLQTKRRFRSLTGAEERELAAASASDRRAARWYSWVQVGGAALCAFYFAVYFIPASVLSIRWVVAGLRGAAPSSSAFWGTLISGILLITPVAIPPITYLRDRAGALTR